MKSFMRYLIPISLMMITCAYLYSNTQSCENLTCPYGYQKRDTPHSPCFGWQCDNTNPGDILSCCHADPGLSSTRSCFDVGFPWMRSLMWTTLYASSAAIMMETKHLPTRAIFYALMVACPFVLLYLGFESDADAFMIAKWFTLNSSLICHWCICAKLIPCWIIYYLWVINIFMLNFWEVQHATNAPWVLLNVFSNVVNNFILTSHYFTFGNKGYASVTDYNNMYFEQFHNSSRLTWAWTVNYWFAICTFCTNHESFGWKQYECMFACIVLQWFYGAERFAMFRPFHLGGWILHWLFFMDSSTECTFGYDATQILDFSNTHPYHIYWSIFLSAASFLSGVWLLKEYHDVVYPGKSDHVHSLEA